MGYDNRPNLNNKQFDQQNVDCLNLKGQNFIIDGGTISSNSGYRVSGVTLFNSGSVISSIRIGCNAVATMIGATAIGASAKAYGLTSISIGCNSTANSNGNISIGTLSNSSGLTSISIGCKSTTLDNYTIAIGACATTCCEYGISIGNYASSSDFSAIALGYQINSVACNTIGIGSNVILMCDKAKGIGFLINVFGDSSIGIGNNLSVNYDNSYLIGNSMCDNRSNSFSMGWNTGGTYHNPSISFSNDISYFYGSGNSKVAFGHCNPQANVDIFSTAGSGFRLVDGSQGVNKVLKSDASGFGTWGNAIESVETEFSVCGNGTSGSKIMLVCDVSSPGINKYYGTDNAGFKGYHQLIVDNVTAYVQLTDVIANDFIGKANHVPIVHPDELNLDLIATEELITEVAKFRLLADVPNSYVGMGGYGVRVKLDESGLEFYAM